MFSLAQLFAKRFTPPLTVALYEPDAPNDADLMLFRNVSELAQALSRSSQGIQGIICSQFPPAVDEPFISVQGRDAIVDPISNLPLLPATSLAFQLALYDDYIASLGDDFGRASMNLTIVNLNAEGYR